MKHLWHQIISLYFITVVVFSLPSAFSAEVVIDPTDQTNAAIVSLAEEVDRLVKNSGVRDESADGLLISIGPKGFAHALNDSDRTNRPVVALFITSSEYHQIIGEHPGRRTTAIYSNANPVHQLGLSQLLLGSSKIAVVSTPSTIRLIEDLQSDSNSDLLVIDGRVITTATSLLQSVASADAVLVLPDRDVFNRNNIRHLIRGLYKQEKVLIGYSNTMTKLGSLASVHPTKVHIFNELERLLKDRAHGGTLPAARFPLEFTVSQNDSLARSLNLSLLPNETVIERLQERNRGPSQ